MKKRSDISRLLSERRQAVVSLLVTVGLLVSLVAFASPSAAVSTTLSGPSQVEKTETVTVDATVELRRGERIPLDAYTLTFSPTDTDEAVTVTFAPNGTVLDVAPERGVVGNGEIRVRKLARSLEIEPTGRTAGYGYGARTGYDESTGESRDFGYGYGYGYGYGDSPAFEYRISFDAGAFKRGSYAAQLRIDTGDDDAFASNELEFAVTNPNQGGTGDGDDGGADDGDDTPGSGDGDDGDHGGGHAGDGDGHHGGNGDDGADDGDSPGDGDDGADDGDSPGDGDDGADDGDSPGDGDDGNGDAPWNGGWPSYLPDWVVHYLDVLFGHWGSQAAQFVAELLDLLTSITTPSGVGVTGVAHTFAGGTP